MPRLWIAAVALLGLAGLGCELTAELGSYATTEETGGPDSAPTGSEDGAQTGGETGEGDAGDGDGDVGDGDGDSGDGDGDDICAIDGSESPCEVCLEHLCCEQLEACDGEAGCFCMLECLENSDPVECAMSCIPGLAYFQLVQCQATSCGAVCE